MGQALPKYELIGPSPYLLGERSRSEDAAFQGPRLALVRGGVPPSIEFNPQADEHSARVGRELAVLCLILVVLQFLDFALTAIGVSHFGIAAEGNPLIRNLMHLVGPIPALLAVKLVATLIIYLLFIVARQVKWIRFALRAVIALYLCAAVLPWSGILLSSFLL